MVSFPLHTLDSAPESARPFLASAKAKMGFVPNLFAKMAEAPTALEAYMALSSIFEKTSLSAAEQQVVLLSVSVENACEFCVAAHSGGAKRAGVPESVIAALRDRKPVSDNRIRVLSDFTATVVRDRGWVSDAKVQTFLNSGFTQQNVLEVVIGIALKTLSNYTNHIASTPLNDELSDLKWSKPE